MSLFRGLANSAWHTQTLHKYLWNEWMDDCRVLVQRCGDWLSLSGFLLVSWGWDLRWPPCACLSHAFLKSTTCIQKSPPLKGRYLNSLWCSPVTHSPSRGRGRWARSLDEGNNFSLGWDPWPQHHSHCLSPVSLSFFVQTMAASAKYSFNVNICTSFELIRYGTF